MRNAKRHVARHVQVREQCVVLKYHAHVALLRRDVHRVAADDLRPQRDAAAVGTLQPRNGPQQRGFAAA